MTGWMTTAEAARRLGLSTRQVANLVRSGALTGLTRGVLDATSVDHYDAIDRTGTQAWAERTAWAAVALLSRAEVVEVSPTVRSRLRRGLAGMTPAQVVERARNRASVTRWSAHPSTLRRLAAHVVEPSAVGLGLAAAARGRLDGYVGAADLGALVAEHGLRRDEDGPLTLRATTTDLRTVRTLAEHPVLAALDLAASLDPRERSAGLRGLERALGSRAA